MTVALASRSSPAMTRRADFRGRLPVGGELGGIDVVEALTTSRSASELPKSSDTVVDSCRARDVAVARRVVVVRVDHDFARQRLDRNRTVVLQRDRDHDDVSGPRRVDGRRRARLRSELGDERGQSFRPARIADHDIVAICHRQSCDLASDVPRSNESDGRHDGQGIGRLSVSQDGTRPTRDRRPHES